MELNRNSSVSILYDAVPARKRWNTHVVVKVMGA